MRAESSRPDKAVVCVRHQHRAVGPSCQPARLREPADSAPAVSKPSATAACHCFDAVCLRIQHLYTPEKSGMLCSHPTKLSVERARAFSLRKLPQKAFKACYRSCLLTCVE